MIRVPSDYESARAYDGANAPTLPVGGHICRILAARQETARTGTEMLVVAFDIAEGGAYDGYYKERHERAKQFRTDAKWPGIFRAPITNKDGKTSGYFKGLITSVEESNAGYSFKAAGFDEGTLKNKMVGFNFGEEEYLTNQGEIKTSVKPFYAVSVKSVRDGIQPPAPKKLRETPASASQDDFVEVHEKLPWDD